MPVECRPSCSSLRTRTCGLRAGRPWGTPQPTNLKSRALRCRFLPLCLMFMGYHVHVTVFCFTNQTRRCCTISLGRCRISRRSSLHQRKLHPPPLSYETLLECHPKSLLVSHMLVVYPVWRSLVLVVHCVLGGEARGQQRFNGTVPGGTWCNSICMSSEEWLNCAFYRSGRDNSKERIGQ